MEDYLVVIQGEIDRLVKLVEDSDIPKEFQGHILGEIDGLRKALRLVRMEERRTRHGNSC